MEKEDIILKYLKGELSQSEKQELFNLLAEDEALRERFYKQKNWWVKTAIQPVLSNDERDSDFAAIWNKVLPQSKRLHLSSFIKYAAIVVITLSIGGIIGFITNQQVYLNSIANSQVYSFSSGERSVSEIVLPDSSIVRLNANTTITFQKDMRSNSRLVTLDGEAFFEVTHDEKSPFIVDFEKLQIVDLGTAFNIKAYDRFNSIETSLVEGAIQVRVGEQNIADLSPNQKALYNRSNYEVEITNFDSQHDLAWTDNRFIFQNANLYTIANELSLWYGVDIKWETSAEQQTTFHLNLDRSTPLESILEMLKISSKIDYKLVRKNGKLSEVIIK